MRHTLHITHWRQWDREINRASLAFHHTFGCAPNILLANQITFQRIDMIANKQRLTNHDGALASPSQYCSVGGFNGDGYALDFCLDDTLADRCCVLLYDANPDGDGEPIPLPWAEWRTGTE